TAISTLSLHDALPICRRGEGSVTGVRQPDAAKDIKPRLLAPDRPCGKVLRLRRMRQHVDEYTCARAPDGFGLSGCQNARAGKGRSEEHTSELQSRSDL